MENFWRHPMHACVTLSKLALDVFKITSITVRKTLNLFPDISLLHDIAIECFVDLLHAHAPF